MTDHTVNLFDIAAQQINCAIAAYHAGSWFCAASLAFAAEGVLHKCLIAYGIDTAFKSVRSELAAELDSDEKKVGKYLRELRDTLFHGSFVNDEEYEISEVHIRGLIYRNIADFKSATGTLTEDMRDFAISGPHGLERERY